MTPEEALICAACGYQWSHEPQSKRDAIRIDTGLPVSTFYEFCPVCDSNLVHTYANDKQEKMGDEYDNMPWY